MKPKFQSTLLQADSDITRRQFIKFCGAVTAVLGLETSYIPKIAEALTSSDRPPVLWLHFSECTGCTESILRTSDPFMDGLLLDIISLDYHETLMAAAGQTVEDILSEAAETYRGEFFCVVEGSIPTAKDPEQPELPAGFYGMIGGRTMLSIAEEILPKAKAIIACGTCASYGGLAAASPNPTGAKGVTDVVTEVLADVLPNFDVPIVNLPGCPPNPVNFVAVLANYLLNNELPRLDAKGRPTFAYGRTNHQKCPFKQDGSRCQKPNGCKGQWTYNNCTSVKFNEGTSFPMQVGHPCIGCSEPNFWDEKTPFFS